MADQTISQLPAYTNPQSTDILPIVDLGAGITKKIALSAISTFLSSQGFLTDAPIDGSTYGRKNGAWSVISPGSGSVTSVSVVTANGVSGSVSNPTTTPAITLILGDITPSSVNSVVISGLSTPSLAVTGAATISGSNTGDQTNISGNAATVTGFSPVTSKILTLSNSLTFSGTDGSTLNIGTGGTLGTAAYVDIGLYATLVSPTFTGVPLSPTASVGTNTTQIATTAFVQNALPTMTSIGTIPSEGLVATSAITIGATTMNVGSIVIPFAITVNNFTIRTGTVSTSGTVKLGLYSYDGQTKYIDVTSPTLSSSNTVYTASVSSVVIPAGIYYVAIVGISTINVQVNGIGQSNVNAASLAPSGKNICEGHVTVSSGTLPSTFDPTAITYASSRTLTFRLDN